MADLSHDSAVSQLKSQQVSDTSRGLSGSYGTRITSNDTDLGKIRVSEATTVGGYERDELEKNSDSVSSWHFDLGPLLKASIKEFENAPMPTTRRKSQQIPYATSTTAETLSTDIDVDDDDDDDDLSMISQEMLEAKAALLNMTKRAFDQSYIQSNKANSALNNRVNRNSDSVPDCPEKSQDLLSERRASRAARMEKVRQRIEREREEAQKRKKQQEKDAKALFMSEESRRQRTYEWYCRLGMPNRKDFKKKIRAKSCDFQLSVEDVDLLPWNFNGSALNASNLRKRGVALR